MKTITIENQEVINHLEALGYESNARKDLLAYLVQTGVSLSDPSFQAYHKEFEEAFARYELAKSEFEKQYVRPLAPDGRTLSWNLDFASRELTVQGVD